MSFANLEMLMDRFCALGVEEVLCKPLAENDNSKQQVYVGNGFKALQQLPYGQVRAETGTASNPVGTFKAAIDLSWIDAHGHVARASGSQLILYPEYPEVRLSGFLRGCAIAPSVYMRPVPAAERKFSNGPDGRVLFLGLAGSKIYAYLALPGTTVAGEFASRQARVEYPPIGVFYQLAVHKTLSAKDELIKRLRTIHRSGWHEGTILQASGIKKPYAATNGGGYTLEALFGIVPNGRSEPDFRGWELKTYGRSRITVMTPEPDLGFYGMNGAAAFVRRYGRLRDADCMYFTGAHKIDHLCATSGLRMKLIGYDGLSGKITDVTGSIDLLDSMGGLAAQWSFQELIAHWGRKHASAAYVPYKRDSVDHPKYRFGTPVLLGEGTDFTRYLAAMHTGKVVYDPGSSIKGILSGKTIVKARNQFRVSVKSLSRLYETFSPFHL